MENAIPQKDLLAFFSRCLSTFQASTSGSGTHGGKNSAFQVLCTHAQPPSHHQRPEGPAAALQHRVLAAGSSSSSSVPTQRPTPIPPAVRPRTLVILDSSFNPPTLAHLRMATTGILASRQREAGEGRVRLLLVLGVTNADKAPKPAAFEQRLAMMWQFANEVRRSLREAALAGGERGSSEGGRAGADGDLRIDVCLSSQPYFHAKSEAIAQSDFYKVEGEGGGDAQDDPEQVFLVGYDTLVRIFNPKYYGPPASVTEVAATGETPLQKALDPFFRRARLRVTSRTDAEWGGKHEQTTYLEDMLNGDGLEKIGGSREWAGRIEVVEGRAEGEPVISSTLARDAARQEDWPALGKLVPKQVSMWIRGQSLYRQES